MSVNYKNDDVPFDMYARPIDQWCLELLDNLPIISQFHWDAERHYKYNGMRWVRFIDEPWTADEWWEVQVFNLSICKYCVNTDTMMFATYQSALPVGAVPFCIVLYADKTRLSSFGTAKGYPVIARSANLPAEMRNSTGFGGGRLVGWLPIVRINLKIIIYGSTLIVTLLNSKIYQVQEDAGETGKKGFVNFKRIVWHESFYEILRSIEQYSQVGLSYTCADNILRWIYFIILIISADYEEQYVVLYIHQCQSLMVDKIRCVISLTRGTNSNHPCPICLVPRDKMTQLSEVFPLRDSTEMKNIYDKSQTLSADLAEALLKSYGLRDIKVSFKFLNNILY